MSPSGRPNPPGFSALPVLAAVSLLLAACGPSPSPQHRGFQAALRAERTCRRILADLPAGISVKDARKAYGHCLRVMNEEK